jgi:hypothetical protein
MCVCVCVCVGVSIYIYFFYDLLLFMCATHRDRVNLEMFDVIFWLGDLNYRIDMPRSTVIKVPACWVLSQATLHAALKKELRVFWL